MEGKTGSQRPAEFGVAVTTFAEEVRRVVVQSSIV
jgi:hypothetical protein